LIRPRARARPRRRCPTFDFEDEYEYDDEDDWNTFGNCDTGIKFHTSAGSGQRTAGLIGKETDERRTFNIQHRTSNNVFCPFKKD